MDVCKYICTEQFPCNFTSYLSHHQSRTLFRNRGHPIRYPNYTNPFNLSQATEILQSVKLKAVALLCEQVKGNWIGFQKFDLVLLSGVLAVNFWSQQLLGSYLRVLRLRFPFGQWSSWRCQSALKIGQMLLCRPELREMNRPSPVPSLPSS